eukprot:13204216-Alexandrium_andersonii.AAC.1
MHCAQERGAKQSEIRPATCVAAKVGCDLCASPPAPGMLRASVAAAVLAKKAAGWVAVASTFASFAGGAWPGKMQHAHAQRFSEGTT